MLIKDIPRIMIICFLLTSIVEILGAYIFKVRKSKDFLNIFLVNLITNPIVVITSLMLGLFFGLIIRNIILVIIEILVILVEGFVYCKYLDYKKINPYLLSLILNFLSFLVGEIYWRLV